VLRRNAETRGARTSQDFRDTTRALLAILADVAAGREVAGLDEALDGWRGDRESLAGWLTDRELAPLAHAAFLMGAPDLASVLTEHAFRAAATNLGHFAALAHLERRFAAERIPIVLLKGASIATTGYADPSLRPMTDLDIWVRDRDMPGAMAILRAESYRQHAGVANRPPELQRRSGGELVFRPQGGGHRLVELHFSPFQGWWIQRTAAPDLDGIWARCEAMGPGRHARRLADEDAILQTAFHVAVNQFGQAPLRGLMDLAVLARIRPVDWTIVAQRARSWRLAHVTWLVLDAADRLFGLPGGRVAIDRLRPTAPRRALLRRFVTPESVLAGRDLTRPSRRHPFMLALADRRRDGARLVGRALWPEPWWIAARHGRSVGRFGHVWEILRRGDV